MFLIRGEPSGVQEAFYGEQPECKHETPTAARTIGSIAARLPSAQVLDLRFSEVQAGGF
jgi:hypothetical protein